MTRPKRKDVTGRLIVRVLPKTSRQIKKRLYRTTLGISKTVLGVSFVRLLKGP